MDVYSSTKDVAIRAAAQLTEQAAIAAERAAVAWRANKPTTLLGWTVRMRRL